MFIDASVIVAIIAEEEGYEAFQSRLVDLKSSVYISAITDLKRFRPSLVKHLPQSSQQQSNWPMRAKRLTAYWAG